MFKCLIPFITVFAFRSFSSFPSFFGDKLVVFVGLPIVSVVLPLCIALLAILVALPYLSGGPTFHIKFLHRFLYVCLSPFLSRTVMSSPLGFFFSLLFRPVWVFSSSDGDSFSSSSYSSSDSSISFFSFYGDLIENGDSISLSSSSSSSESELTGTRILYFVWYLGI